VASSGQRKGARRVELGIAGDVIALAPLDAGVPHIISLRSARDGVAS